MKHMSVVLDLFILLDTVRIILLGGVGKTTRTSQARRAVEHPMPEVANLTDEGDSSPTTR